MEPVTIDGGHTNFDAVLQAAREWGVPSGMVPFCEDNGDYFCIAPTSEVVYWSHDGVVDERWPNPATWILDVWIGGH